MVRPRGGLGVVVAGEVAHPLGERLGGERRLVAVLPELLDGHVAGVKISTRGIIRVGRDLSHTQTSSILSWKNG